MTPGEDDALDIARRIADGEAVDLAALQARDPALARRLGKLQALARSMQGDADAGHSWGHLQQLQAAGKGGFGAVYRAYDPTLDRTVALKLRHERSDALLPSGRDFVAEARRLARVRHPNVLAVHGASYHDGRAGIWADWIEGETLSARLQRSGALPREELLRVLAALADALAAVHRAGLVHGDIKASNVMLDRSGRVILMDFGAGFDASDEGSLVNAGTPRYLAPEIVAGKPATSAVDIYAFGVLAHLLASNRYPEDGRPTAPLRPRALSALLRHALDPDPHARPDAERLHAELQRLIDAPRHRVRRLLFASVVIGLGGIVLVTAIGLRREQAQRQLAERARDEAHATATFLTELLAAPAPEAQGREVRVVELLDSAVRRTRSQADLPHATRAGLLYTLGRSQLALNRFRDADATLGHAWALDTPEQPLADMQALQIGLLLAEARLRRQRYDESDAALERLAADPRWRQDDAALAAIAVLRSTWWQSQGKFAEAAAALASVLDAGTGVPADTRIDALAMQAQLAFDQGELARSEAALQAALDLFSSSGERFGVREYELRTMLANVYSASGRYAEGEAMYRALLPKVAEAYGEGSLSAGGVWSNIAVALNSQARYAESLAILREWLPKAVALDSEESHLALNLRAALAVALQQSGELDAALAEFDRLIPQVERFDGPTHPNTLVARFNRVETLNDAGRSELALRDGRELRETMAAAMGEGHPFTLETEDAIGFALTRLGRATEAEAMHRRTIEGKTATIGADNPYTLLSQEYLARALIAQRRHADAAAVLAPLLRERERVLGAEHPKTVVTRELLASLPR
jgi:tetratricopeptide (TPR) repeat protein